MFEKNNLFIYFAGLISGLVLCYIFYNVFLGENFAASKSSTNKSSTNKSPTNKSSTNKSSTNKSPAPAQPLLTENNRALATGAVAAVATAIGANIITTNYAKKKCIGLNTPECNKYNNKERCTQNNVIQEKCINNNCNYTWDNNIYKCS